MEKEEDSKEVEWSIILLFDSESRHSTSAATLFQLKIRMTEDGERIFLVDNFLKQGRSLYPRLQNQPGYVCCAPLGNNRYFITGNDLNRFLKHDGSRTTPIIMDAATSQVQSKMPCQYPKAYPFVGAVGNKVYVLSRRVDFHHSLCEPSFEKYDLDTGSWETLSRPWFNENEPLDRLFYYPVGFAVFGEFILVSVRSMKGSVPYISPVFSYSTTSGFWKPVKCFPQELPIIYDGKIAVFDYRVWVGEAVVYDGFIYGHALGCQLLPQGLVSYSCTMEPGEDEIIGSYDLSMGEPNKLCQPNYLEEGRALKVVPWYVQSKAVAKFNDGLLCAVNTVHNFEESPLYRQPVLVTILRISKPGHCTTLKVLELSMPVDNHFRHGRISSCLVLKQEEMVSDMELGEPDQE